MSPATGGEGILLRLEHVTFRIRDNKLLPDTNWEIRKGEQWAIVGPNGSGKSTIARTIAGELPTAAGHIRRYGDLSGTGRVSRVSFELQRSLLDADIDADQARHFAAHEDGEHDATLTARRVIASRADRAAGVEPRDSQSESVKASVEEVIERFDLKALLDQPFRTLSSGEMRKTLIVAALAEDPTLLVLDEPFDGLDHESKHALSRMLMEIVRRGVQLVLVSHREEELVSAITHVLMLDGGGIAAIGARDEVLKAGKPDIFAGRAATAATDGRSLQILQPRFGDRDPIVEFRGVTVRYGPRVVLDNLNWTLRAGERWAISGPNGSGKTTIVHLVFGENLQVYANDVRVFNVRRGEGESIWELRRRIGIVTPRLQLSYRADVSALEAVVSGFFDSIGLFRRPTADQLGEAEAWLRRLDMAILRDRPISQLSYGQRTLVLIARAMVKSPELLILDEPCLGLDPTHRAMVLDAVDRVCAHSEHSLMFVTHNRDELPLCLTHELQLSVGGGAHRITPKSGAAPRPETSQSRQFTTS